jgi:hypothetical protein
MTWKQLKRALSELEQVVIKIAAIIGLFLLMGQALGHKFWDFISAWKH